MASDQCQAFVRIAKAEVRLCMHPAKHTTVDKWGVEHRYCPRHYRMRMGLAADPVDTKQARE